MSQLQTSCVSNHNEDAFYEWLVKHRLEFLHDKLVSEGFENVEDFQGMNENKLLKLWNKIGNNKIGVENRFITSIKNICLKPAVVVKLVTDEENKILSNLKQTITKYQSIIKTQEAYLTGVIFIFFVYIAYNCNCIPI